MAIPRPSRTCKAVSVPLNAPTMPEKTKGVKGRKSHGKRPAKSKASSPNEKQHLAAMAGQLDTPLPGAVPGTADSDEGVISEGNLGRGDGQNKTTAQIRLDAWNDGLLDGFLNPGTQDGVCEGFTTLHRCISNFARSMTEAVD
ncbi:predicted protein [Chaetomium globosum CBS 148.51]|uniref:Uncharacterized protein n=1 Tax=Chaetomium globosum (strain ATCC 6205 / CBS 148.51 / DSM 1962 / NBRC 6347 / NRRL 1970) TaxID=306901 RepID=Q2H7Z9_CHAGB|nr:uncharacterized protein CHGG_03655 [Chaetomium globosum CBS 148.51]EAQ91720.1 predicted protein [Chaetomium globosum CBS 148.51]